MSNVSETEKGFAARAAETPGEQFAHRYSVIANPLFVALPLFLFVALKTAPDWQRGLLWWGIVAVGFTAAPFFFIRQGVRRGKYTDDHVSVRSQRVVPLSFGLLCMIVVFVLLLVLHAAPALLATLVAALSSLAIATAITQFASYKISLHMIGMAGAVTTCVLLAGPWLLLLAPLVPLTAWARWKVGGHTPPQAAAGTILAVAVTLAVFWIFHII
jgi:hypothetical protein